MRLVSGLFIAALVVVAGCASEASESTTSNNAALTSCDNPHVVNLRTVAVDDATNAPVGGVATCVERTDAPSDRQCRQTNANGRADFAIGSCEEYRVTYSKAGYADAEQRMQVDGWSSTLVRLAAQ